MVEVQGKRQCQGAPHSAATVNNAEIITEVHNAVAPTNADTYPPNVQARLESALNLFKDNIVVKDYIAEAMNTILNE